MPIRIESSALKTATKLTSRVKDVEELGDGGPYWNTVHRLVATPEKLRLLTTDKDVFLDWSIPLSGTDGDEFDLLVPAVQFNTVARHGVEGTSMVIHNDGDLLTLSQSKAVVLARDTLLQASEPQRTLRIRTEEVEDPYPPTPRHTGSRWTTRAQPLAQALAFVAAHGWDVNDDVGLDRRVTSWLPGGQVLAGNRPMGSFVTGLDSPPVHLNVKNDNVEVVSAFLKNLGEQVEIDVAGTIATFRCPAAGHTLVVPVEQVSFPEHFKELENRDHEVFRTDLKTLQDAVETLGALVPPGKDHLELRLAGDHDSSTIHLSTPTETRLQSSDVLPAVGRSQVRHLGDESPSDVEVPSAESSYEDTVFLVPWESLSHALRSLNSVTVELRYLPDPRGKGFHYLRAYAVEKDPQQPVRSLILQVGRGIMGNSCPGRDQESPLVPDTASEGELATAADVTETGPENGRPAGDLGPDTEASALDVTPIHSPAGHDLGQQEPPTGVTPPVQAKPSPATLNGTGGRFRGTRQR